MVAPKIYNTFLVAVSPALVSSSTTMSDSKALIEQAEKLCKPQLGFFLFISGSSSSYRLEEASDLYIQAANQYRLQKDFTNAGNQFIKASELQEKLGNHNDVANNLIEAYKCYKTVSPTDAIDALKKAIHIFLTQNGQFRRAANFMGDLAELYQSVGDVDNSIKSYEEAGDYFSTDHADALANKSYLKSADLYASIGNYKKAIELYNNIIKVSLTSTLSRWSLKDYFFKVILCLLCLGDPIEAQKKSEEYSGEDSNWAQSREFKLTNEIFECIEQGDAQAFADKVYEYDQFTKLDKLKTQLLLKVKTLVIEKDDEDDLL